MPAASVEAALARLPQRLEQWLQGLPAKPGLLS